MADDLSNLVEVVSVGKEGSEIVHVTADVRNVPIIRNFFDGALSVAGFTVRMCGRRCVRVGVWDACFDCICL